MSAKNNDTRQLKCLKQRASLKQIILDTTRFSSNKSYIDLHFSDSSCINLHDNWSDHEMIYVTCKPLKKLKHLWLLQDDVFRL